MPPPALPHRILMPDWPIVRGPVRSEAKMLDVVYLALGSGLFALMALYVSFCDRL